MNKDEEKFLEHSLRLLTFTGEPLQIGKGISIYQYKVKDILSDNMYNANLFPFIITTDYFLKKDASIKTSLEGFFKIDEKTGKFKFEEGGIPLLTFLISGLKKFLKVDDVNITVEKNIVLNKEFVINENNFEDIATMIAKINGRERIKELIPPEHLTDAQREVWIKTMTGRRKKAEKESLSMTDMVNVLIHFNGNYNYESVLNLTLLQLYNSFNVLMKRDKFDRYYQLYSSGQFEMKNHEEHWINAIRSNYKGN